MTDKNLGGGQLSSAQLSALCANAAGGDRDAFVQLVRCFMPLVKYKTGLFFIAGAERDDVIQEGLIGLYGAVKSFDESRGASFYSYADLCITNQIKSAVKAATRRKHSPLNSYLSIDKTGDCDAEIPALTASAEKNPESVFIDKERLDYLLGGLYSRLSSMERRILELYLEGRSYREIAKRLGRSEKSVDNAISRVKRKIGLLQLNS